MSILLGVAAGFLIIRLRRSRRSKRLDEKSGSSNSTDRPSHPPSTREKAEKRAIQAPTSNIIENPFLSPEELASAQVDGRSRFEPKNDIPSVTSQTPLESDDPPSVLIDKKPRRNFSLPRSKDGRKRLSTKTPKPEPDPQAGAKDWTDMAEARQQAKKEASREPPAPILRIVTDNVEPTKAPAAENPFEDVNTIDRDVQGEQFRGADRRHISPLRRNPVVKVVEDVEPLPPLPSSLDKQRAVSPLRRNPVFYSPAEEEPVPPLPPMQPPPEEQRTVSPPRQNHMIRMPPEEEFASEEPAPPLPPMQLTSDKQRAVSPLRRNPVIRMPSEEEPVPPLPSPPLPSVLAERRQTPPILTLVLEQRSRTPPVMSSPPSLLEERRQISPVRPVAIDTSLKVQEPVLPSPSSLPETRDSSPARPNLFIHHQQISEPPSLFDETATLPTSREEEQQLSPLRATMSLLSEIESLVSDAEDFRNRSPVRNSTSSQTINSLIVQSEMNSSPEKAEDTEWPWVAVSEDTSEDNKEQSDDSSDEIAASELSEAESEEPEVDERAERGRSMIRTSDIIEARLSAIARARAEAKLPDIVREEEEFVEDSPQSSVATSLETSPGQSPAEGPESPPRKRPQVVLKSSPLVFNKPRAKPKPTALLRPAQIQSKAESNAQFSQAFLMFKSLDSKNPQNSAAAFSEVNHRALAGIHVPASLREQAVRNLSKSRERGKSRARE